ncbi:hypothetical protein P3T43_003359 [Paraburkholderia sp. GAS41]|uniref:hypothetical protein n=1 Tax=Paraburkholderia sp. GAS41 TaxID=3035134 RepID=UPI003D19FB9A
MTRGSAVTYLLEQRRAWFAKISATATGDIETESHELQLLDRLILDVRAGRVHTFELTHPKALAIFVTG